MFLIKTDGHGDQVFSEEEMDTDSIEDVLRIVLLVIRTRIKNDQESLALFEMGEILYPSDNEICYINEAGFSVKYVNVIKLSTNDDPKDNTVSFTVLKIEQLASKYALQPSQVREIYLLTDDNYEQLERGCVLLKQGYTRSEISRMIVRGEI